MVTESVNLDLYALSPDQQVDELKRQYVSLRGRRAEVRARRGAGGAAGQLVNFLG
jgi:hypothetical protein